MKRVLVVLESWVVMFALLWGYTPGPVAGAWADTLLPKDATPEMEITENDREPPAPKPESKARLEVLQPDFDFGAIRADNVKSISHTYTFRNTGEEKLVISKTKPSCGCTSAVVSATEIAPGASASMVITLDPKGKYGNQNLTVRAYTNDPTNPAQVFRFSGSIMIDWRIVPTQLDMGAMGKLQSVTKDVVVTSQYLKDERHYKITSLKTNSAEIQATTAAVPPPDKEPPAKNYDEVQQIVRVHVTAGSTEGEQSQRVLLATDDPKNPTHTITVRWNVEGDLYHTPKRVYVSNTRGKKISRDLTLSSRSGTAFEVTSIEQSGSKGNDDLEITLKPGATPTQKIYTVSPKFVSEAPSDTRSGKIIFKTDSTEQPEITVNYIATFRKQ